MINNIEFLLQIIVCFILSACIGIERQYRRRSIGLRTIILVSIGSFLFVRFSYAFPNSDMNRIAAQVVAGIGFLGAGVILKDGKSVKGLTTAATLWCSAAIGVLCAANLLFEAAVGTLFILFTNIILRSINTKINNLSGNTNYDLYYFNIVCPEKEEKEIFKIIKHIIKEENATLKSMETNDIEDGNVKLDICILSIDTNSNLANEIMQKLSGRKDIISISLNKKDQRYLFEEEEL